MLNKLSMAIRSRTVWTVIALVVINGVTSVSAMIPAEYLPTVTTVLGAMAILFRVNPRQ